MKAAAAVAVPRLATMRAFAMDDRAAVAADLRWGRIAASTPRAVIGSMDDNTAVTTKDEHGARRRAITLLALRMVGDRAGMDRWLGETNAA